MQSFPPLTFPVILVREEQGAGEGGSGGERRGDRVRGGAGQSLKVVKWFPVRRATLVHKQC